MESYKFQFHIFSIVIILVQSKELSEFYLDFHHEKIGFRRINCTSGTTSFSVDSITSPFIFRNTHVISIGVSQWLSVVLRISHQINCRILSLWNPSVSSLCIRKNAENAFKSSHNNLQLLLNIFFRIDTISAITWYQPLFDNVSSFLSCQSG